MARILLFGAAGQLGREISSVLPECAAFNRENGDICNFEKIAQIAAQNRPAVIINAAAFTAVDLAESQKESAFAANAQAVKNLAEIAKKYDSLLVHFSTDYVFDGEKSGAYLENDLPNPQNIYGESKLQGENAILKSGAKSLILRTSWVFGALGGNFVKSILKLAAQNEILRIVNDQIGCPTSTRFLAEMAKIAIPQVLENPAKCGLYHLTQSRAVSWFEFTKIIVEKARALNYPLKVKEILPITTAEFPRPARRPKNSILNCEKFARNFNVEIPSFENDLQKMLEKIKNPR